MEDNQDSRPSGTKATPSPREIKDKAESMATSTQELGEKMKKMDTKPPVSPTLSLLAKNAALVPSGIIRVKQLRDAPPKQLLPLSSSGSATGNPRNKTALAPGHSLMDWIRLGSSGVDLTGVGGKLLTVTPTELVKHNKENDAWIAIRGVVYNVSRYMSFHPGGVSELMKGVGKDATKLFDEVHAWVNYQSILQKCIVGRLERSMNPELNFKSEKESPKKKEVSEAARIVAAEAPAVRQTTNTISFFYATPADNPPGECQISRLGDSEFSLRIFFDKTRDIVKHSMKLAESVEWPPNCQRSSEAPKVEIVFKKQNPGIWKTYGTHVVSAEKIESANRTYNEYEVLENTLLCKVVHLLVLRAQNYIQLVPPGRHVEIKMNIMGEQVSRPYTPVPCWLHPGEPRASSAGCDCLCLMVKRYEGGALSPSLTALEAGKTISVSSGLGGFCVAAYDSFAQQHLLVAGTGLTVALPIIKRALARRNMPNINLVIFNRNEDNIFYDQELGRVAEDHDKLTVTHVLSAAKSSWSGRTGNITKELLQELMGQRTPKACVFTCGPTGFMTLANELLRDLGWEASQMYEFAG